MNRLPGGRLHLQHGPIDVVLQAWGTPSEVAAAEHAAAARFAGLLEALVAELPELRRDVRDGPVLRGAVARRMLAGCAPFAAEGVFVTAMAAVAGAVADELLAAMRGAAPGLRKAFVNDGGDIAVFVGAGETLAIGLVADPEVSRPPPQPSPAVAAEGVRVRQNSLSREAGGTTPKASDAGVAMAQPSLTQAGWGGDRVTFDGTLTLKPAHGIGGVATSGRHGRSFSLGIADAVTVLARDAATADAAATLIANAVDLDSPAIARRPAWDLDPDSDLGHRLVTTDVGPLANAEIAQALDRGAACAQAWTTAGHIRAAALRLRGATRIIGLPALTEPAP